MTKSAFRATTRPSARSSSVIWSQNTHRSRIRWYSRAPAISSSMRFGVKGVATTWECEWP